MPLQGRFNKSKHQSGIRFQEVASLETRLEASTEIAVQIELRWEAVPAPWSRHQELRLGHRSTYLIFAHVCLLCNSTSARDPPPMTRHGHSMRQGSQATHQHKRGPNIAWTNTKG